MDTLKIGFVIGVQDDRVSVEVTAEEFVFEYKNKTYRVGRIGSYIAIPMKERTLLGFVTAIDATYPVLTGDRPPVRITCQLLGTIEADHFTRGINQYPTCGDPVRVGVDDDFRLIFGEPDSGDENNRTTFTIGRFALDPDFKVDVMGKEFFAKHVAVMGNSGSGKSVSTAKILHEASRLPHSQVVVFDLHGEYMHAFTDDAGAPKPHVTYLSDRNLVLPYWLLAYEEFEQLFVDTTDPLNINSQKVFLRMAFERLKLPAAKELGLHGEFTIDTPIYYPLEQLLIFAKNMNAARFVTNTDTYAFSRLPFRQLPREQQEEMLLAQVMEFNPAAAEGETPHATFNGRLLGLINALESKLTDRRYDFLLRPFEQARHNMDLAGHMDNDSPPAVKSRAVCRVIRQMLGQLEQRKNLTIIDLSGLPFEVIDVTIAVLTRALFDFNFWTPTAKRQPVLLVYEEAHNYLPRKPIPGRKTFARQTVEKVAKEGRKYGVAAMIVSQRPSEISETVLSQCNTMVLLRMNNPDDQEYAARVVSDQFRSLISLLPSLRPGEGFVIGDAVLMPMRTLIDLPPKMPQSGNVDFFGLWSRGAGASDVETIVDRWWRQQRPQSAGRRDDPAAAREPRRPKGEGPDGEPAPVRSRFQLEGPAQLTDRPDEAEAGQSVGDGGAAASDVGLASAASRKLAELAAFLGRKKPE